MPGRTVSVVIPAYRTAGTLGRAVESLLTQTRPPDDILVIDDGSPDDVAAALRPYGGRVRLFRQDNGGAASARNRGLDLAAGDLVGFLDADDYWEPVKLERQLEVLDHHPRVALVATRFFTQPPGGPRIAPHPKALPWCDRLLEARGAGAFEAATCITTSTVLVCRRALGDCRFDTTLRTAEDVDLWVRLVAPGAVYLLSEPLVTLVLEPGSLSRSDVADDCANMLRVVARHAALLGPAGVRSWEARVFRDWAAGHLGHGEPRAALRPAWRRLRHEPWSPQGWWVLAKSAAWACNDWLRRRPGQPAAGPAR
jgi:glycosyltransferase involved in cell wall biosynthesis